jgi:hypothetical protein
MKTFSQFMSESGGSPGRPYIPQPGPTKPTQPEEGFDEFRKKYGLPPKNPIKLAKAIKEDFGKQKEFEQERKKRRRPAAVKAADRDLAKLSYMLNLDRPGR